MPQVLRSRTFDDRVRELYEQAAIADKSLGLFMRELNAEFPGVIKHPPLKLEKTAREKLMRADGGAPKAVPDDPSTLRDICRATIEYKRLETMYSARDMIKTRYASAIDAEKDRYSVSGAVKSGYRDIKFFLKLGAGQHGTHICELQLNISTALVAKEIEHPVYEILRRADASPTIAISATDAAKLAPKLRSVYTSTKRAGFLSGAELSALRDVVLAFYLDPQASRPRVGGVSLSQSLLAPLGTITPKIYKHYEKQALEAKFMTADGFRTQLTHQQMGAFT